MLALHWYVIRLIVVATMFVTIVLLALIAVIQSLRLVEFVVNRGLPASVVFELLLLRTPSFMTVALPIAFFTSILFIYTKLQSESELVIMRSTGLSEMSLARPAIAAMLLLMGVSYALSFYLIPISYGEYKEREFAYKNVYGAVMLQAGKFNTPTDAIAVYVRERIGVNELRGILIRDGRDPDRPTTILAERGLLTQDENGPRVVLFDGNRQEIDDETGRLIQLYFNQYSVNLDADITHLRQRRPAVKELLLPQLLYPGDTPNEIRSHDLLIAEGHRRIAETLYIPALGFMTLAFLLLGETGRRGSSLRVLGAVGGAVILQAMNLGLSATTAKSLDLLPVLYAVPIIISLAGFGALWHGLRPRVAGRAMPTDLPLNNAAGY